jgi:2,4-dienoyl-CoA reductase-like NADH-dependent reductase (Old Yellow Enzyme family)
MRKEGTAVAVDGPAHMRIDTCGKESLPPGMEESMSRLFEATEINGMALSNRFVRSATWEGMATEDGAPTVQLVDFIGKLAGGGVGLIISSYTYIRPDGKSNPGQLGIHKDELVDGFKMMTDAAHAQGAKILSQITHAGLFAKPEPTPLAPSEVDGFVNAPQRAMRVETIQEIADDFARAAKRAKESGFDGIQIFAGHGYLLSQFLSPAFNKRTDAYGGTLENRARILLEVLEGVRMEVGQDYPVLVKMNSEDFLDGGLTLDESLRVGVMLCERGVDAIELSGGTWVSGDLTPARGKISSPDKEAYFREAAKLFKETVNVPLILVGGIRSFGVAEQLIEEDVADYVSMCRPLVREPGLVNRWKAGNRTKSACVSCGQCGRAAAAGGIYCVAERRLRERSADPYATS